MNTNSGILLSYIYLQNNNLTCARTRWHPLYYICRRRRRIVSPETRRSKLLKQITVHTLYTQTHTHTHCTCALNIRLSVRTNLHTRNITLCVYVCVCGVWGKSGKLLLISRAEKHAAAGINIIRI